MDCNEEGDSAPPKYWLISFPYSRGIISRGLPRDFVLLIGNTIASTKSSVKDVDLMLSVLTTFFFFFLMGTVQRSRENGLQTGKHSTRVYVSPLGASSSVVQRFAYTAHLPLFDSLLRGHMSPLAY